MKKIGIWILVLAVLGAGYFYRDRVFEFFSGIPRIEKPAGDILGNVEDIAKEILTPPPLRINTENKTEVVLTGAGVLKWVNFYRLENGLRPLAENSALNSAALMKTNDMFKNQYFAHVSPVGIGVDIWVGKVGYEYLTVGENLALGNFESDEALVRAWMDSPGHRANILNSRFAEIGIAVKKDEFEKDITWLGVQVFGTPMSECDKPSDALAEMIELYKQNLNSFETSISVLRAQIENKDLKRRANKDSYILLIEEYNTLVGQYNNAVEETKNMISRYNEEVRAFNNCVAGD